jgi:enoyl-CoA hydratase
LSRIESPADFQQNPLSHCEIHYRWSTLAEYFLREYPMPLVLRETPMPGVTLLRLNRPERLNALSMAVREELADRIHGEASDENTRCVVITGDIKAFAAGADVDELVPRTPMHPDFARSRVAWAAIEACTKPIIAAVNGFALGGGCELAMHCDVIIAGQDAKFGQPEVKLGIMPGAGGTQRLLRVAGKFAAMRWLLTGDVFNAEEAQRIGLVSEIVEPDEVVSHSLAIAARIAALPSLAVGAIKESLLLGADAPLASALALERKAFQLLFATEDKDEGIKAFRERRTADFKGR